MFGDVDWAGKHWSVDQNPGMGTKGLFYYYNIMAKSLSLYGDQFKDAQGKAIPWKAQLIKKFAKEQQKDGHWINSDASLWEGDAALVTAYSVLALQFATGK